MKRLIGNLLLATVVVLASFVLGSPAKASVPNWDAAPSAAKMAAIEAAGQPAQGEGWAFRPARATVETPAMAAKRAASDCAALGFFFCTWKDTNYSGLWWAFSQNTINGWYNYSFSFRSSPPPGGINNTGSSWVNNTTHSMRLFDDVNCDPLNGLAWYRDMTPGQQAVGGGSDWNDRVSAIGWIIRTAVDC